MHGDAVKDETGKIIGFFGVYTDITLLKQAEVEIQKAKEAAEAGNQAKSQFLANMSHEIRTPLNAITGLVYLLLQTELTTKQCDFMNKIQSSAHLLLGVINDILDFSKIEAGKLDMESTVFQLDSVLYSLSNMMNIKAAEKDIEMLFSVSPGIPRSLVGDSVRIEQVLANLLNNAVKFTEAGEIVLSIEPVFQNEEAQNIKLLFTVRDTGIGMSKEHLSRVFKPFIQADGSTTRKFGGTGLGLTICKRLVDMMGGEIAVESEPGKGSVFSFTAVFGFKKGESKKILLPSEDLRGAQVLLADDNETSREILRLMLESLTLQVKSVSSGKAAIEELEKAAADPHSKPYKLVIMDWAMPDMDGFETIRRIKTEANLQQIPPIIMVTAFGREEIRQQAEKNGLDAFLTKPVFPSILYDTIISILGKGVNKSYCSTKEIVRTQQMRKLRGARVLLVEDNLINQQVASEILNGAGIAVETANNGQEAVWLVNESAVPYDAVLMDLQMPEMDGFEATRAIRSNKAFSTLPIIAMTANAMKGDREACLEAGMNDHVAKPINVNQLLNALARFIKPGNHHQPCVFQAERQQSIDNGEKILPPLPGVDIQSALNRLGGNTRLFKKILIDFKNDHTAAVAEIREQLEKGDLNQAGRLAHTLKGIAGNIGAMELFESANALDLSIRHGEKDRYTRLLKDLEVSLTPVLNSAVSLEKNHHQQQQSSEQTDKKTPLPGDACGFEVPTDGEISGVVPDLSRLTPLLEHLNELLKKNNMNAGKQLTLVQEYLRGTLFQGNMREIEDAINNLDFKRALLYLENTVQKLKKHSKPKR